MLPTCLYTSFTVHASHVPCIWISVETELGFAGHQLGALVKANEISQFGSKSNLWCRGVHDNIQAGRCHFQQSFEVALVHCESKGLANDLEGGILRAILTPNKRKQEAKQNEVN